MEHRYQQLKNKYSSLWIQGRFNIPERYAQKHLADPSYNRTILKSYLGQDGKRQLIEDREIIEMISYIHKPLSMALLDVFSGEYGQIPSLWKYKSEDVINADVYNHGPPLNLFWTSGSLTITSGVVISNHKFLAYFLIEGFSYETYERKLNALFNMDKIEAIANNMVSVSTKGPFLTDTPAHLKSAPVYLTMSVEKIWDYFSTVDIAYTQSILENVTSVANKIESGTGYAMSFGQFAQVFPCLKQLKLPKSHGTKFRSLFPTKLQDQVYVADMTCSSNFTDEQTKHHRTKSGKISSEGKKRFRSEVVDVQCTVNYKILVDLKHQLVIIQQMGTHCQGCSTYQEYKGYLFYRKQLELYGDKTQELYSPRLLLRYGNYTINTQNKKKWFKKRMDIFVTEDSTDNYSDSFSVLMTLLANEKTSFRHGDQTRDFCLDPNTIHELITYDGGYHGLLIASVSSISKLAKQKIFGIDVTFNVTTFKGANLITVVYSDDDRKIQLGCVGILYGGESSGNIQAFADAMIKAAGQTNVERPFQELEYIITGDSQGTRNGLSITFGRLKTKYRTDLNNPVGLDIEDVKIVKCIWHKRNNLIDQLDRFGADFLSLAMWDLNPITCRSRITAVIEHYRSICKCLENPPEDFPNTCYFYYYTKVFNKTIQKPKALIMRREAYHSKVKKMLAYVEDLQKDCASWCLSHRIVVPVRYNNDSPPEISSALREKMLSQVHLIAKEDSLDVDVHGACMDVYRDLVVESYRKNSLLTDVESEELQCKSNKEVLTMLKRQFTEDFNDFKEQLPDVPAGLAMTTINNNERIHNVLKQHYGIKNLPSLTILFLELQNYFIKKSLPDVPTKSALEVQFPFQKTMTHIQLRTFNEEMLKVDSATTVTEIELYESKGLIITENLCVCSIRIKECVPCKHMLRKLKDTCKAEVDIEVPQNPAMEDVAQYERDLEEAFLNRLATHANYMSIVEREADFQEVIDMRGVWELSIAEDLEKKLEEHYFSKKSRPASKSIETNPKFLGVINNEFMEIFRRLDKTIKTADHSDRRQIFEMFLKINDIFSNNGLPGYPVSGVNIPQMITSARRVIEPEDPVTDSSVDDLGVTVTGSSVANYD